MEEKNKNPIAIAEDTQVMKRLDALKESKCESHRLSMMTNGEAIARVKKRSYAEFCVLEKQVKAEIKKTRKRKEKSKWIFNEKAAGQEDDKENEEREANEEEAIAEELEISKVVQEGIFMVWNEPPD